MNIPERDATLRRIATRLLAQHADQEDAVQDTWLVGLSKGSAEERTSAWWKGVLRNRGLQLLQRRRRRKDLHARLEPVPEETFDPADEVERELVREVLLSILDRLPETQADVLRQRFFEGLSLEEIASRSSMPLGTVKSHLSRGLEAMRRRLEGRVGDRRLAGVLLLHGLRVDSHDLAVRTAKAGSHAAWIGAALCLAVVAPVVGFLWFRAGSGVDSLTRPEGREGEVDRAIAVALDPTTRSASVPPDTLPESAPATGSGTATEDVPAPETMRVTFRLVDPEGTPALDAGVRVLDPNGPARPLVRSTDASGAITLEVGRDDIVDPAGVVDPRSEFDPGCEYVPFTFEVPGTAPAPDLWLPFSAGTERTESLPLDVPSSSLLLRLEDETGRPLAGARIRVGQLRSAWNTESLLEFHPQFANTDAQGLCRIQDVPCGSNQVRASSPGRELVFKSFLFEGKRTTEVHYVLHPASDVSGVVRDNHGRAVEGARVFAEVLHDSPDLWATSDATGHFQLSTVPVGPHRLVALGPPGSDFEQQTDSTTMRLEHEPVVWNPILQPPLGLRIEVVNSAGIPMRAMPFWVAPEEVSNLEEWRVLTRTNPWGWVEIPSVPREPLRIEHLALLEEGLCADLPYRIDRGIYGGEQPVRIVVDPSEMVFGSISAQFVRSDGAPEEFSPVCLGPLSERVWFGRRTSGSFYLFGLPPGRYLIGISPGPEGWWLRSVELGLGEDLELGTIRLPETGTLRIENRWPAAREGRPLQFLVGTAIDIGTKELPLTVVNATGALPAEVPILPGRIIVLVLDQGVVVQGRTVEVRSGQVSDVLLDPSLEPGEWAGRGR